MAALFVPIALVCVATCGDVDVPVAGTAPSVDRLLGDTSLHRFRTRGDAYPDEDALVARIAQARLTHDGNRVIVLDRVAPFIKVYREDGSFDTAYVDRGSGPGEAGMVFGIAAGSGNQVLLIHDDHTSVFRDGRLLSSTSFHELGFYPLAAAEGCGDHWFMYGPKSLRRSSTSDENGWLYRQPVHAKWALPVERVYSDSIFPSSIGFGALQTLVGTEASVVFGHRYAKSTPLLDWRCDTGQLHALPRASSARPRHAPREAMRSRDMMALSITAGTRSLAGFAPLGEGFLVADRVHTGTGGPTTQTELSLVLGDSIFRAATDLRLTIQDGRPGIGALVSTTELVPRVFLLPEPAIINAFRNVPPANRGVIAED